MVPDDMVTHRQTDNVFNNIVVKSFVVQMNQLYYTRKRKLCPSQLPF